MIVLKVLGFIILTVIAVFILLVLLTHLFPIVEVVGESMHPTYKNGEFILSFSFFRKKKIKIGDVLVFKAPYEMGEVRILIKRVMGVRYEGEKLTALYLVGDNRDHSFDSRNYGYVDIDLVISKVIRPRKRKEVQQK